MSILNRCDLWNTLYAYSLYGTKRGDAVNKILQIKSCVVFFCCSLNLKLALSQKMLEKFYISNINIPNHYPEQKI